jgi:outer membrane protein OmpA-like peptidoglycan-associated protein
LGAPSRTFDITVKVSDGDPACDITRTVTVEVTCEEVLEGTVNFGPGSARLDNIAKAILDNIATSLQQFPDQSIILRGYSDNVGTEEANRRISQKRAEAVRDYLVRRHGIDPGRITIEAHGSENPVASNETEEGRRQNRRVEIYRVPFK